jgi:hypothetical protein
MREGFWAGMRRCFRAGGWFLGADWEFCPCMYVIQPFAQPLWMDLKLKCSMLMQHDYNKVKPNDRLLTLFSETRVAVPGVYSSAYNYYGTPKLPVKLRINKVPPCDK